MKTYIPKTPNSPNGFWENIHTLKIHTLIVVLRSYQLSKISNIYKRGVVSVRPPVCPCPKLLGEKFPKDGEKFLRDREKFPRDMENSHETGKTPTSQRKFPRKRENFHRIGKIPMGVGKFPQNRENSNGRAKIPTGQGKSPR